MTIADFVIKYDPNKDNIQDLTERIIYSLVIKRLKNNKPVIWYVGGDSGEGKSMTVVTLQELLLRMQGLAIDDYLNDINVYTPLQYPEKLDAILGTSDNKENNKRLKKVNIIAIHEAREVLKAKMWYSFLNQAISDVNAMSRSIKRVCTFIVSQFIRDISTDIRYTIYIYSKAYRPRGHPARLYINILWKDDSDLEKPKLRKRKLTGFLVYPNGRYRRYTPKYLELTKPRKDLVTEFETRDREAKISIVRKKLDRLIKEMKIDLETENSKVIAMVEYYSKHPENLHLIGKRSGKKFIINKDIKNIHGLSDLELKDFTSQFNEKLRTMKLWSREEKSDYQDDYNKEEETLE